MPCHCGLREQQSIDSNGFLPIDRGNLTTSNLPRSKTPMNTSTLGEFDFGINDDFDDEFTNYLFESLTMPYCFPNPKENNGSKLLHLYFVVRILLPAIAVIQGV